MNEASPAASATGIGTGCQKAQDASPSFRSAQDVKWCPGCGDHAILNRVLKLLPELGIRREQLVFVSGIGCSSRFPYYVDTYGFHGIHGRAPAIATGLKCANPDLQVWVVTGDGDSLSIGTNHLIHGLRRNMDFKILLFNNHIYGLTKGQYSPTSEFGKVTKSSPVGTIEQPLQPVQIALAAQATFVARTVVNDLAHLGAMLEAMARHKGAAFLEILLNCLVFNPADLGHLTAPDTRDDARVLLRHGEKIIFGKKRRMGLVLEGSDPRIVDLDKQPECEKDVLTHNTKAPLPCLAQILASLEPPAYPTAMGIFRAVEKPTYEQLLMRQIRQEQEKRPARGIRDLLDDGTSWDVP